MEPVSFTGQQGAGLYGAPRPTHKTGCKNSNNPNGHNKECGCGWWAREQAERASQVVPYLPSSKDDLAVFWRDE